MSYNIDWSTFKTMRLLYTSTVVNFGFSLTYTVFRVGAVVYVSGSSVTHDNIATSYDQLKLDGTPMPYGYRPSSVLGTDHNGKMVTILGLEGTNRGIYRMMWQVSPDGEMWISSSGAGNNGNNVRIHILGIWFTDDTFPS